MAPASEKPTIAEPRRFSIWLPRPLWIGLASIVLVVVAVGLQFGLPIYRQQMAIRAIERVGGRIDGVKLRGPDWLRKRLGDERMKLFNEVTAVDLYRSRATDVTLSEIRGLSGMQRLNLVNANVTDAGLVNLKGLAELRLLLVSGTRVTDAGLVHLKGLTSLRWLLLDGTEVTDAGMPHLKDLRDLEWLGLCDTRVTDRAIAELQRSLPRLQVYRYLFAHPRAGQVYLTTSDIVVTGAHGIPDLAFTVQLRDSRDVIWQSAGDFTKSNGCWSIRLTYPEPWHAGDYTLEFTSALGFQSLVPLKIIHNEKHRVHGRSRAATKVPGGDGRTVTLVRLPETSVIEINPDEVDVARNEPGRDDEDFALDPMKLTAGEPFELAGRVLDREPRKYELAPVVVQVVEVGTGEDEKPLDLIVFEDVAEAKEFQGGFAFSKSVNAPHVAGRYVLRAYYRRTLVSETIIDVEAPEPADGRIE
jgi:hypothetical protein